MPQVVIGTAGHIDHGKTALVKALTGTDTDRLPEEKERGMTIDLGFAFLTDDITIIDVPGHEKFIRNMVAGVSAIDMALVTVAANDGVMPQTREHIDILRLLSVGLGCIAVTKTDLVEDPEWVDLLEEEIREYVSGSFLEDAPILRVSSETGEGVDELKSILLKLAEKVPPKKDRGFFRHHIDRTFSMKGFGTVVTGTVVSGSVKVGCDVEILPTRFAAKVRGIQSHGEEMSSVQLGDRAALNLSGVDRTQVKRGYQLASKGFMVPTSAVGVQFFLLPLTERVVRHEQRVRMHLGTDQVIGKVHLVSRGERKVASPGETWTALIKLEREVAVAVDDPFIMRFYSPLETIGGGVIIDTGPPSSWRACRRWLRSIGGLDKRDRLRKFLESTEREPLTLKGWSARWQLSESLFGELLEDLPVKKFGSQENPFVTLKSSVEDQKQAYVKVVDDFHRKSPYKRGISKDRLRQVLGFHTALFQLVTHDLESERRIETDEGTIRICGFHVELTDEDAELASRLETTLRDSLYTPPTVKELAKVIGLPEPRTVQLMHVLKGQGKAEEVNRKLWFHIETLTTMENEVRRFLENNSSMAVNDFKSLTRTTRKHAIPLLEYLDECRVTRREGDQRVLSS